MRSHRVVVLPPSFDDNLSFVQRVEDFSIKELVAELRVEALAVAILPGAAGHDVGGLAPTVVIHSRKALVTLSRHIQPPTAQKPYIREDHFSGGRPVVQPLGQVVAASALRTRG